MIQNTVWTKKQKKISALLIMNYKKKLNVPKLVIIFFFSLRLNMTETGGIELLRANICSMYKEAFLFYKMISSLKDKQAIFDLTFCITRGPFLPSKCRQITQTIHYFELDMRAFVSYALIQ